MQLEEFQARKKAQRAGVSPQQKAQVAPPLSVPPSSPPVQLQASPAHSRTGNITSPTEKSAQAAIQPASQASPPFANGTQSVKIPSPITSSAGPAALPTAGASPAGATLQNGTLGMQQQMPQTASPGPSTSDQQASSAPPSPQPDDAERLKKQVQSLKVRLQKQEKEAASLREQLQSSLAPHPDRGRHEADTAALVQAQDQITSLTAELATQRHEHQELQAKLASAESKEREAGNNQAAWELEKSGLQADLQQALSSISELNAAAAGHSTASDKLLHQLQEAQEACDASKAAADAKQAEMQSLESEVKQLKSSLEEARLASQGDNSSHEELASLRQEVSSFEEQVRSRLSPPTCPLP